MKELDADINDDNLTLTSVCKEEELLLDGCEHQRLRVNVERKQASVCKCESE